MSATFKCPHKGNFKKVHGIVKLKPKCTLVRRKKNVDIYAQLSHSMHFSPTPRRACVNSSALHTHNAMLISL